MTAAPPRTSGSQHAGRLTADERRDAIVVAAMDEVAAHGLSGASTNEIARRAGVSQPYVFQLFGTKKELFLAVVRSCFERTTQVFERAAADYVDGSKPPIPNCNSILGAIGVSYMELLSDRTVLLVQLQAYAACSDPDVQAVVRDEFARLHRMVARVSGATPREMQDFFAQGMLLNVAAAMGVGVGHEIDGLSTFSLEALGELGGAA